MTPFVRNALLGAAGLVVMSLPAGAASSTAVGDSPVLKNSATTTNLMQLARDENPGGAGYKAKKKKKKKKAATTEKS
jgi:hypothetical protein